MEPLSADSPVWKTYRQCTVCGAPIMMPCVVRSGKVVDGQPDGVVRTSDRPHISRRRRTGI